jgi:hypothetical protein
MEDAGSDDEKSFVEEVIQGSGSGYFKIVVSPYINIEGLNSQNRQKLRSFFAVLLRKMKVFTGNTPNIPCFQSPADER